MVLLDEKRKTLDLIADFLHLADAFRSISYAFRSLHPKITNNLPINYVTDIIKFEVINFEYSSS